jgi:predicted outer membrane lipoprotein
MALFAQLVLAALWLEQVSAGKKQRQDVNMARRSAWKSFIRTYHFWWKYLRARFGSYVTEG